MNAATHDDGERLAHMATEVAALQAIGQAWPLEQRAVLDNLRGAIEALHREALVRLLKGLRAVHILAQQRAHGALHRSPKRLETRTLRRLERQAAVRHPFILFE